MLGHLPDYKHTEVTEESLPQVLWSLAFHGEGAVFDGGLSVFVRLVMYLTCIRWRRQCSSSSNVPSCAVMPGILGSFPTVVISASNRG